MNKKTNVARLAKTPKTPTKRKLNRVEKAEKNRQDLMQAAMEVIGERGYNEASISRITERAGIAAGTFYRYFESRQALFDVLLPEMARDALSFMIPRVHGSADLVELETRGLEAMLQWEIEHPGFARMRNEAEIAAPPAFESYLEELLTRYTRALKRGQEQGYLQGYNDKQLRVVASMLIGARHYLHYSIPADSKDTQFLKEVYQRFVEGGLRSDL